MWQIVYSTFILIFLAELGDKTQLAVFARAGQTGRPGLVFIGAAAALVCSTLIGVLIGGAASRLPPWIIKGVAGLMFIGFGIWTLVSIWRPE